MNTVEIFKPGIAELRALAEKHRGLTIAGPEDVAGYEAAKTAKKELADWRITITKAGKKYREEALAYQREVIRQEKEHLEIITPVEDSLKAMIETVDVAKAREERRALIPSRRALLAEYGVNPTDEELIALDEKEFEARVADIKMAYLAQKEAELKKKEEELQRQEDEKRRQDELKKAEEEAAKRAVEEEQARVARAKAAEEERVAREAADAKAAAAKARRNTQYREWLAKHGVADADKNSFKVEQNGNTFTLWKKVDELTID